jgi:hypothetical protein
MSGSRSKLFWAFDDLEDDDHVRDGFSIATERVLTFHIVLSVCLHTLLWFPLSEDLQGDQCVLQRINESHHAEAQTDGSSEHFS